MYFYALIELIPNRMDKTVTCRIQTKFLIAALLSVSMTLVQAATIAQTPDTSFNRPSLPDSSAIRGQIMINDQSQAEKILNESVTIGMLDSLMSLPFLQDYYFNTDTSILNVYNFPVDAGLLLQYRHLDPECV